MNLRNLLKAVFEDKKKIIEFDIFSGPKWSKNIQ